MFYSVLYINPLIIHKFGISLNENPVIQGKKEASSEKTKEQTVTQSALCQLQMNQ